MFLTRLRPAPARTPPAPRAFRPRVRRGLRHVGVWRRSRPFWGAACTVLAGVELLSIPFTSHAVFVAAHSAGAGIVYLLSITMVLLGLVILLQPAQRVFLGVTAVLLSAASVVYANVGGFLVGAFLGLLGGAATAAWTPVAGRRAPAPPAGPGRAEAPGSALGDGQHHAEAGVTGD